ncbi:MFS transporter [Amycolatopsis tucumanensis]|uniref:MFS transporter n=1 Tax=Amycolatopsis tucumanensis TaxID=401106 RepID=A0ABP7JL37_9PSEU|nr:MFS transporter [Amycolatopsis tucumanensis]MCF6426758.1 MFS transporter [Amycolatopsis tucumanensis]
MATLVIACAAAFLVLVNFTAPLATLGEIADALGAGPAGQTWILGSISLGLAAALLIAGSLADTFGRRRVFVLGGAGLAAGSVLCALAPATWAFVLGRIVQGVAGAALLVSSLGLIAHAHPAGAARVRATGLWGAMLGGGITVGPVMAALLTAPAGWRSVYWLIALLGAAVAAAGARLPESRGIPRPTDFAGLLTLGPGIALLVAALTEARAGWDAGVVVWAAPAVVLLGVFVVVELRVAEPMIDLRLLRAPAFRAATTGALTSGIAVVSYMTFLPSLLHRLLGLTPLAAAAVVSIWSGVSFVVAAQARRVTGRLGDRRQAALGLGLCAAGELATLGLTAHSSWWHFAPGLAVAGVGTGLSNAALAGLSVRTVPPDRAAMGTGANNTARYVGSALGIALVAVVLAVAPGAAGVNYAAAITGALALLGAVVTALSRERVPEHGLVSSGRG